MSSDDRETALVDGITAGLDYSVGFLTGAATGFTNCGRPELADAFNAAAAELRTVTPQRVRRGDPPR